MLPSSVTNREGDEPGASAAIGEEAGTRETKHPAAGRSSATSDPAITRTTRSVNADAVHEHHNPPPRSAAPSVAHTVDARSTVYDCVNPPCWLHG